MGLYVVGGWTEYLTEGQIRYASDHHVDVADPNALDVHSFDEWGDNSVLPDNTGTYWWHLMALGKTNAETLGEAIWYRSFFIFTSDPTKPNAKEIIGGKQLFWREGQTAEDYAWGDPAEVRAAELRSDWVGIGVSVPGVWGKTEELDWEDTDFPEGGGDPSTDVPSGAIPGGAQLFSVAKHDPWGWSLSQIRLYLKPATGQEQIGVVGWTERVKDMAGQQNWVVTNHWGRSSTERSQTMGVGQWRTAQWGWGPSLLTLHFAPTH